jgi:hypothetical protein
MFSRLRCQDKKKIPKFSHLINITHRIFNTSPHKRISCLRSNKSWLNNFFTHLIYFLYQNLKQFLWVSIHSVSKIWRSHGTVSSNRQISKVIFTSFTWQNDATSWHRGVAFLLWCRDCSQSAPTTQSLSQWSEDCIRGQEAYPSSSVACMSLYLATLAHGSWLATSPGQALGGKSGSQ